MTLVPIDKFIRILLGFALVFWAASGGPMLAYLGIYLLLTGCWGFCPAYGLFKSKN